MKRTDYCGRIDRRFLGQTVTVDGLGASAARSRRRHLHRPARPRRPRADRVRSRSRRDVRHRREASQRVLHRGHRARAPAARGHGQPESSRRARSRCSRKTIEILNASVTPPFQLDDENLSETVRLTHRVLDLRRPQMQNNLMLRYRAAMAARKYLDAHGFIDIETPVLYKSTPEGAREFLVPSRMHHGPVLRAAAVAAALQADADDRGLRSLLPDRQVLPRRGPARRPPAGVHADRHRDVVPRRARDPRR